MQCAVSLNQRKSICPLFMMLHELERAEEADENEDGNGDKQNAGQGGSRPCKEGGTGMTMSSRSVCQGR
jgi:hypothetical protein